MCHKCHIRHTEQATIRDSYIVSDGKTIVIAFSDNTHTILRVAQQSELVRVNEPLRAQQSLYPSKSLPPHARTARRPLLPCGREIETGAIGGQQTEECD